MDPQLALVLGTGKKALLAIPAVKKYIESLPDPNTPRFIEARDEMFRDWNVELHNRVAEVVADLVPRIDDLEARISERAEDGAAKGVFANYANQAYREPIAERRKMLQYAAAGIIDVQLSVAEHARVQRRLDELDPGDVLHLLCVERACGRVFNERMYDSIGEMRYEFWRSLPNDDALSAAGCVHVSTAGGGAGVGARNVLEVTSFGKTLLRVLRGYCRARELRVAVPGREIAADACSREEAYGRVDQVPGLAPTLRALAFGGKHQLSYHAPEWWRGAELSEDGRPRAERWAPPRAKGAARIECHRVQADEANALIAMAPLVGQPDAGEAREEIGVDGHEYADRSGWSVRIHGPHEVLRWLADDLEVPWFAGR